MSKHWKSVAIVAVVTLLSGTTAFAQEWSGPGGPRYGTGGGAFGWRILRAVGLSDDQKAQIRQVYVQHRPQLQALRNQLRTAQGQLGDRLYSTTPPTPADLALIGQLRDQLAQERLAIALAIRNVLTADQLAKAAQIRQQLKDLRQQERNLLNPTS
jgi:Spy/CpxP family protein refolding chaperone